MSSDFYEYVSPENWKTLNALVGFGRNAIAATEALAGQELVIDSEDVAPVTVSFVDGGELLWNGARQTYIAREVADEMFFVEFQLAGVGDQAIALVLDLERLLVTTVLSTVLDKSAVHEEVTHGWLLGATPGDRHERTAAMVGRRVQYVYSDTDSYEHIYLNDSTYSWHCLAGDERGEADTEPTLAYELRENVYLFTWRERVVPCDGVVVIDWIRNRLNGRIFGWDTSDEEYNSISMGARAVPLNTTTYAPLGA